MRRRSPARKRSTLRPSEADVLASVLAALSFYRQIRAWRQNTGAVAIPAANGRRARFIRFGRPGAADITGIVAPYGRRLEIECKAPGGELSTAQLAFANEVWDHGGIYLVVRSVDDLIRGLGEVGVRR